MRMTPTRRLATVLVGAGAVAVLLVGTSLPAAADPISAGKASAVALVGVGGGQGGGTPEAAVDAPTGDDDQSVINTDPPAAADLLGAMASVHEASDIVSELDQDVDGPFNAQGLSQIVSLALGDENTPNSLVLEALTAEAVAVCTGGVVTYSANSEIAGLVVGGVDVIGETPIDDLLEQITAGLNGSPLAALIKIELNVIDKTADGISVDALKITIGGEAGGSIVLGHAEVANVTCAPATPTQPPPTVLANPPLQRTDPLPRTGGTNTAGVAAVLGASGLALYALRRRLV